MNRMILAGILIPFAGTTLGSAMVFFMRKEMNEKVQKLLLGFASGVMIAASVWSLLIPAIEMAEHGGTGGKRRKAHYSGYDPAGHPPHRHALRPGGRLNFNFLKRLPSDLTACEHHVHDT